MKTARRILHLLLALALASSGCCLGEACSDMLADECCCGIAGSPCREMSGGAQDDADPWPDATLRVEDHASAAVFHSLAVHPGSAPPEVKRDERPPAAAVSVTQALYVEHCAFLC
jgi:hypothetical protein